MKVAIITAAHGRFELTDLVYQRLQRTIEVLPFEVVVVVAGSEVKHHKLADEYGWKWIATPNHYTSTRFVNAMWVAQRYEPDYVMTIGTDDLILPALFEYYIEPMEQGVDFFGVNTMHFYDLATNRMKLFTGYAKPQTIGAGRMYSAQMLDQLDWNIWRRKLRHGLDSHASQLINMVGFIETLIEAPALMCDVKSELNINSYDAIPGIDINPDAIQPYLDGLFIDDKYFNFKKTLSSC